MRAFFLTSVLFSLAAAAQKPVPTEPLPPPEMDEPGVTAQVPTRPPDTSLIGERQSLPRDGQAPIQDKIQSRPSEESAPTVTIRTTETGDTVEEYRQNGRLTMIKVTPQRGPSYMLIDTDGDGRVDRSDGVGAVAPIYYKLYEWD